MTDTPAPMIADRPFAAIFFGLALTVLIIGFARVSGYQANTLAPLQAAEASRLLQFEDAPQGMVIVRDAKSGETIRSYGRGEGSFIRATLRALVNDRRHKGTTLVGDFRLEAHAGRQLFLIDEATGRTLSLNAYGPDNAAAFAALMSNPNKGEGL